MADPNPLLTHIGAATKTAMGGKEVPAGTPGVAGTLTTQDVPMRQPGVTTTDIPELKPVAEVSTVQLPPEVKPVIVEQALPPSEIVDLASIDNMEAIIADTGVTKEPVKETPPPTGKPAAEDHPDNKEINLGNLRKKIESYEQVLRQKDAELETLRRTTNTDRLKQLEDENVALKKVRATDDLRMNPVFQQTHIRPLAEKLEETKLVAKDFGVDAKIIENAASIDSAKDRLAYLTQNVPEGREMIIPLMNEISVMRTEITKLLNDSQSTLEDMRSKQTTVVTKAKSEMMARSFTDLSAKGHAVFTPKEGDEKWNKNVEAIRAHVKHVFDADPEVKARYLVLGTVANIYRSQLEKSVANERKLAAELAAIRGATPGVGAGGRSPSGAPGSPARMSADDAARAVTSKILR